MFTNAKVIDAVAELNIDISDIVSINLNEKKPTCEIDNYYVLLTFLLVTMSLYKTSDILCDLAQGQKNPHITILVII